MKTVKGKQFIKVLMAAVLAAALVLPVTTEVNAATKSKSETTQESNNSNSSTDSNSSTTSDASATSTGETVEVTDGSTDVTVKVKEGNNNGTETDVTVTETTKNSDNKTDAATEEADDTSSSKKTTTSSNSSKKKTTTSSGSSKTTTTASDSSDGYKELMTEKQRKKSFWSKTNPKMGTSPITPARPASAGFSYASFGVYNDYNSKNHLAGTPIYLIGTVMDVQAVKEGASDYKVAILVNDCDGYQWYLRAHCDKLKFGLLKSELLGKAGYIYGTYAGYSGVTQRPMMDMTMMIETPGNAVNMALYK